jgi:hypothetical protein
MALFQMLQCQPIYAEVSHDIIKMLECRPIYAEASHIIKNARMSTNV